MDEDNNRPSIPAYMLAQDIARAASGIDKLVSRVLVLANEQTTHRAVNVLRRLLYVFRCARRLWGGGIALFSVVPVPFFWR